MRIYCIILILLFSTVVHSAGIIEITNGINIGGTPSISITPTVEEATDTYWNTAMTPRWDTAMSALWETTMDTEVP